MGRTEERGILNKNAPPLPGPLHFMEEREKIPLPGGFETISTLPRFSLATGSERCVHAAEGAGWPIAAA